MSNEDLLHKRGVALENQFFSEVDAKLFENIRSNLEKADNEKALAEISGLQDTGALEALIAAGLSPATLPALRLFPLIAVAWADGRLETSEKVTILDAAAKHGVGRESNAGKVIAAWLEKDPGDELFSAWEVFANTLVNKLPIADALTVQSSILEEVKAVAQAAGGLLGWNAISKGESVTMNRIEKALQRAV